MYIHSIRHSFRCLILPPEGRETTTWKNCLLQQEHHCFGALPVSSSTTFLLRSSGRQISRGERFFCTRSIAKCGEVYRVLGQPSVSHCYAVGLATLQLSKPDAYRFSAGAMIWRSAMDVYYGKLEYSKSEQYDWKGMQPALWKSR